MDNEDEINERKEVEIKYERQIENYEKLKKEFEEQGYIENANKVQETIDKLQKELQKMKERKDVGNSLHEEDGNGFKKEPGLYAGRQVSFATLNTEEKKDALLEKINSIVNKMQDEQKVSLFYKLSKEELVKSLPEEMRKKLEYRDALKFKNRNIEEAAKPVGEQVKEEYYDLIEYINSNTESNIQPLEISEENANNILKDKLNEIMEINRGTDTYQTITKDILNAIESVSSFNVEIFSVKEWLEEIKEPQIANNIPQLASGYNFLVNRYEIYKNMQHEYEDKIDNEKNEENKEKYRKTVQGICGWKQRLGKAIDETLETLDPSIIKSKPKGKKLERSAAIREEENEVIENIETVEKIIGELKENTIQNPETSKEDEVEIEQLEDVLKHLERKRDAYGRWFEEIWDEDLEKNGYITSKEQGDKDLNDKEEDSKEPIIMFPIIKGNFTYDKDPEEDSKEDPEKDSRKRKLIDIIPLITLNVFQIVSPTVVEENVGNVFVTTPQGPFPNAEVTIVEDITSEYGEGQINYTEALSQAKNIDKAFDEIQGELNGIFDNININGFNGAEGMIDVIGTNYEDAIKNAEEDLRFIEEHKEIFEQATDLFRDEISENEKSFLSDVYERAQEKLKQYEDSKETLSKLEEEIKNITLAGGKDYSISCERSKDGTNNIFIEDKEGNRNMFSFSNVNGENLSQIVLDSEMEEQRANEEIMNNEDYVGDEYFKEEVRTLKETETLEENRKVINGILNKFKENSDEAIDISNDEINALKELYEQRKELLNNNNKEIEITGGEEEAEKVEASIETLENANDLEEGEIKGEVDASGNLRIDKETSEITAKEVEEVVLETPLERAKDIMKTLKEAIKNKINRNNRYR